MKRKLEQPKIIVYENVEKVKKALEGFDLTELDKDNIATDILHEFNIPFGKKKIIIPFQENISAELVDGKIRIVPK